MRSHSPLFLAGEEKEEKGKKKGKDSTSKKRGKEAWGRPKEGIRSRRSVSIEVIEKDTKTLPGESIKTN